jgi:hypothetical protein
MNLMQLLSHAMDCPKCFSSLNYSWCKGALTVSTTNKWKHCRICSTCLPASYVHCQVNFTFATIVTDLQSFASFYTLPCF